MLLLLLACGPALQVSPAELPQAGYQRVRLESRSLDLSTVTEVTVGGLRALQLEHDGEALTALVQGSPTAGDAEVVLHTEAGVEHFTGVFSYTAPGHAALERVVAIGASLSMGFQSAGVRTEDGLRSPPAQVAQATGAWMGLPLFVEGLIPPLGPEAVDGCTLPSYEDHLVEVVPGLMSIIGSSGGFDFAAGRLDPDVEVTNFGVAGSDVGNLIEVPQDAAEQIFASLVYAPYADFGDALDSQLALAEATDPTIILVMDVLGNEIIDALVASDPLDLTATTAPEDLRPELETLLARLGATEATVFFGNEPPMSATAFAENALEAAIAAGYTAEEAQARLDALDARTEAYNAMLAELAAPYPNVVVVDLSSQVKALVETGVDVGGEHLTTRRLGGLTSLDGVHFSTTGYAMMANSFLDAMDAELGLGAGRVDLEAAMAADPTSPAALRAAGLDPDACGR